MKHALSCDNNFPSVFNFQRPKPPFCGEKFGVEAYLSPNNTAFITADGMQIYFLYIPLEGFWVSGDKNCNISLCLSIHVVVVFLASLW